MNLHEKRMVRIASIMDNVLEEAYGEKMGFFLCVSPCGDRQKVADYVSNQERETGIEWMKEAVERLEAKEDIQAAEGNA